MSHCLPSRDTCMRYFQGVEALTHCLRILAARPHDHVRRRGLGSFCHFRSFRIPPHGGFAHPSHQRTPRAHLSLIGRRGRKTRKRRMKGRRDARHDSLQHPSQIAAKIAHPRTKQPLTGLSEKVGFLDFAFGRVDVWQIQTTTRVASVLSSTRMCDLRVKDGR